MPTYDYVCEKCNKDFSLVLSIKEHDKKKPACPRCQSKKVKQTVGGFHAITSKKS